MEKKKIFETKVCLLGADGAGKTTLLYKLKLNEQVLVIPTIGFNVESIKYKDKEMIIWDIGGGSKIKYLWKHYINYCNYVVFILNLSDKSYMDYSLECFNTFLDQNTKNLPYIIFGNIKNNKIEYEPNEFLEKIPPPPDKPINVLKGDAATGEGLNELMEYLYQNSEFNEKEEEKQEKKIEEKNINENEENENKEESNKNNYRVTMLGLDDSGKTKILYKLKLDYNVTTIPTIGFNVENIKCENFEENLEIFDVGGQEKIRVLWRHYIDDKVKGLIWVYDVSNESRYEESKSALKKVLSLDNCNKNLPLLIFANKSDIMTNDIDITTFINGIEDYLNERSYYIQLCNINDSESLKNGIRWLYENIKSNLIY